MRYISGRRESRTMASVQQDSSALFVYMAAMLWSSCGMVRYQQLDQFLEEQNIFVRTQELKEVFCTRRASMDAVYQLHSALELETCLPIDVKQHSRVHREA